jgi:hypothetical protein
MSTTKRKGTRVFTSPVTPAEITAVLEKRGIPLQASTIRSLLLLPPSRRRVIETQLERLTANGVLQSSAGYGKFKNPFYSLTLTTNTTASAPLRSPSPSLPPSLPSSPVRQPDSQYSERLLGDGPSSPRRPIAVLNDSDGDNEVVEFTPPPPSRLKPPPTTAPPPPQPSSSSSSWAGEEERKADPLVSVVLPPDVPGLTCCLCRLPKERGLLLFLPCKHQQSCESCWDREKGRQMAVVGRMDRARHELSNDHLSSARMTRYPRCPFCKKDVHEVIHPFWG